MSTIPELYAKIERFLAERVLSKDSGFAPVRHSDLSLLYRITSDLIDLKWQGDADGDAPVEFTLVDRNVYQSPSFSLITYRSVDKKRHMEDVVFNVKQAIAEMQLLFDLDEIEERGAK